MRSVRPITAVLAAMLGAVLLGGCSVASSPEASPLDNSGFTPVPVDSFGIPIESTGPQDTGAPGLAGFDGWQLINGQDVDLGQTESGLALTLTKRALWSQASKGVLFYTLVTGDFRVTATVQTSKTSDSSVDPGRDGTFQLAGLMARGRTTAENYVFITVGSGANGLSVETQNTTNNDTKLAGPAWPSGDAELKLCRIGPTFTLWKRAIGSGDDFTPAATYKRNDLTGEVQVGANIYSDSSPDITALFENLTIEPLDPGEAC